MLVTFTSQPVTTNQVVCPFFNQFVSKLNSFFLCVWPPTKKQTSKKKVTQFKTQKKIRTLYCEAINLLHSHVDYRGPFQLKGLRGFRSRPLRSKSTLFNPARICSCVCRYNPFFTRTTPFSPDKKKCALLEQPQHFFLPVRLAKGQPHRQP